ncbi:hypothetical protein CTAYLR_002222 [Chrysophaeum taylorii]|uniref:Transcription-repair-coupling factor n=1 Tax=Chrysophaeum taylorii TaxID=2483200 RepID=A0AAD7UPT4_9STRA|nr:hypothetical protein CTAYLR_002222 [Chrysophaeum taylorii]
MQQYRGVVVAVVSALSLRVGDGFQSLHGLSSSRAAVAARGAETRAWVTRFGPPKKKKDKVRERKYYDEASNEEIERKVVPLRIGGRGLDATVVYEGDYVVHYDRGVCTYAGRWHAEGEEDDWPVLLRFADRVVSVSAADAAKVLTLLRRGSETLGEQRRVAGLQPGPKLRDDVVDDSVPLDDASMPTLRGLKLTGEKDQFDDDAGMPKLSKLSQTMTWLNRRKRAVEASRQHARELVALAAARSSRERPPSMPLSEEDQRLLEEGLGFELTEGQKKTIFDIEEDMCRRAHPMDRLVFGDVGYGKTEVAMRALAIAVKSGKQAAIVAPTTILATQHYNTLRERLGPLGIRVELLLGMSKTGANQAESGRLVLKAFEREQSRDNDPPARGRPRKDATTNPPPLKPRAEYNRVRVAIASGECDVAVGTHALLSRRQNWRRLGLLIIDEEQRFGVTQKEQLKEMCVDVDVLTLSATPIPRTLGAALSGIRDVSELPQPPPGRGETVTYVMPDSPGTTGDDARIAALFNRELSRGGQCFYVVPHIIDIDPAINRVKRLLGNTGRADVAPNVVFAHGNLPNVASIMADFAAGTNLTRPVLVATTLVENGLDLPRVNTIIIQESQRFGLATLHQLRGRVGRSDRPAVACFLHPRETLSRNAYARLAAIETSTRHGGPQLAKKDLEIRGAGALFGTRQSGRVARYVGGDLYTRMLNDELHRLRALDIAPVDECRARLPVRDQIFDVDPDDLDALHRADDLPAVIHLINTWRQEAPLAPNLKLAVKLRMLECNAARLGFDAIRLEQQQQQQLQASTSDVPASAIVSAPNLNAPSWATLCREVPDALRSNLRFDEPNQRVEVVRLGALPPPKQLDFLLEVFMHMATFLERVQHIHGDVDDLDSADVESQRFGLATSHLLDVVAARELRGSELCPSFVLGYLGSNERKCLHVRREVVRRCEDTKGWSDGTNGCDKYAQHEELGEEWCAKYGHIDGGFGSARDECCACGGGSGTNEPFAEGAAVEVRHPYLRQRWVAGVVSKVRPRAGVAYEVLVNRKRVFVKLEVNARAGKKEERLELRGCSEAAVWEYADGHLRSNNASVYGGGRAEETTSTTASGKVVLESAFDAEVEAWRRVVTIRAGYRCLVGGRFAKADFIRPEWVRCSDPNFDHFPSKMFEVECGAGAAEVDTKARLEALLDSTTTAQGLASIAPWTILGVDRSAALKEVKAAFREVSRLLHADKRDLHFRNQPTDKLDAIFNQAHAAYENLGRAQDERARESFRVKAETGELLFRGGSFVVELEPSNFQVSSGALRLNTTTTSETATVWVVMLYSPRCSMSRAVAPLFRLAARAAYDASFGAFACGTWAEHKSTDFGSVFKDTLCSLLAPGFTEFPTVVALVEDASAPRARSWRLSFPSIRAQNLAPDLLDFARRARHMWSLSLLVRPVDDLAAVTNATTGTRVVVFVGDDGPLRAAIEAFAPGVAPALAQAGASLYFADCVLLECTNVSTTPVVWIYGPNKTSGLPVTPEPFGDARDAQIALTTLAATLTALSSPNATSALAMGDDDDGIIPVTSEDDEMSCGSSPPPPRRVVHKLPADTSARAPPLDAPPPASQPRHIDDTRSAAFKLAARPERRVGGSGVVYGGNAGSSRFGGAIGSA